MRAEARGLQRAPFALWRIASFCEATKKVVGQFYCRDSDAPGVFAAHMLAARNRPEVEKLTSCSIKLPPTGFLQKHRGEPSLFEARVQDAQDGFNGREGPQGTRQGHLGPLAQIGKMAYMVRD